uniref:Cadherin domain-containing protein n=1 Tax=Panagrolaimus sp. ES5 TaxID=591445 RepID=A0AC34GFP7_9BILA
MPIFTIKAVDIDSEENGKIFYRLSGDSGFSIDAESGELSIAGALAKGKKHWTLKVIAFDAGSPISLSSEVQIDIFASAEDAKAKKVVSSKKAADTCSLKNNHSPKFSKLPTNLSLKEDAPIGTTVTKIKATDADYGINGIIQFWSEDEFFGIDTYSGIVTIKKPLFELFNHLNNGNEFIDYKMEISATDSAIFVNPKMPSLSTKATVIIRIHDVNNYLPIFEQPIYFTQVEENAGAGIELLRVKAIDHDPGQHGKIEYLLAIDSDLITIDPD